MRTTFLALGLLALLAVNADAAAWKVDHAKSKLWFEGQWSNEPFSATFGTWDANIQFDPANLPASKAIVTIDLGSVTTDDPERTSGMKGQYAFDVNNNGFTRDLRHQFHPFDWRQQLRRHRRADDPRHRETNPASLHARHHRQQRAHDGRGHGRAH